MSHFPAEYREAQSGVLGALPTYWVGTDAPDGDAYPWLRAGIGSLYLYRVSTSQVRLFIKQAASGVDADWAVFAGTNGAKGFIEIPLVSLRELSGADIINTAATPSGGILTKDTTPILDKVSTDTDGALWVRWAASNNDVVTFQFLVPPDLDDTQDVVVKVRAKMAGATDTPTIAVHSWWDTGDTKVVDATAAVTGTTVATYAATIATADVPSSVICSVNLTPGAHTTDILYVLGIWVEYTKK
jgi:hypothetical protein